MKPCAEHRAEPPGTVETGRPLSGPVWIDEHRHDGSPAASPAVEQSPRSLFTRKRCGVRPWTETKIPQPMERPMDPRPGGPQHVDGGLSPSHGPKVGLPRARRGAPTAVHGLGAVHRAVHPVDVLWRPCGCRGQRMSWWRVIQHPTIL